MNFARTIVLAASLAAVSGCGSIGEGSTVKSLEIRAAIDSSTTSPFLLHQCLRDQLMVVATFTDGTLADFSYRVKWTSSDSNVVQVSNNDIPTTLLSGGLFTEAPSVPYRPGTLIPRAASGSATITATFVGITASMQVDIDTAQFKVAPVSPDVDPQVQPALPRYVGPATTQRYAFYIEQPNHKILLSSTLNALGPLNPILWTFVGGELDPVETGVAGDFDKYAVPNAATPTAVVNASIGVVTGVAPDPATTYEVQASTSLCPADPAFMPKAPVVVAPFATSNPLTLSHESNFNGEGQAFTGDLIAGSGEQFVVTGNLDTDNDGVGDQTQDLSGQIDLNVVPTTVCTAGSTNCTCDTDGSNCTKRLFLSGGNEVSTLITNDSADATVQACFADIDTLHTDDCEEDAAVPQEDVALKSNVLDLHAIAVDLTGAGATPVVGPAAPTPERAFSYPGRQFDAYGTFTALDGATTPFNGGTSATGTQKVTRYVTWTTRPQGSTTTSSDVAFVRNSGDAFFGSLGRVGYAKDVTANTIVDINFALAAPFASVAAPATPVPFTVCPSTASTCP